MKKMLEPEIEFVRFRAEDVITTSGGESTTVDPMNNGGGQTDPDYNTGRGFDEL